MSSKARTLGQHFLVNPGILEKIVRTIDPQKDELIVEIGAGKGVLTFPLAARAGKVITFEKDRTLVPFLKSKILPNLVILEQDVLEADFEKLVKEESGFASRIQVVGNLPYSISSPLLFKLFEIRRLFDQFAFLVQKEFGERLCSRHGSKKYAPLSILFQIYFSAKLHFFVSPGSFSPPPKVDSAFVTLTQRDRPLFQLKDEIFFRKFLRAAFRQRRKTLANNLRGLKWKAGRVDEALRICGIEKNSRPEDLPIERFVALSDFLQSDPPSEGSWLRG